MMNHIVESGGQLFSVGGGNDGKEENAMSGFLSATN
jgi:hypothetical protein